MKRSRLLRVEEYFRNERAQVSVYRLAEQTDMSSHQHEFWEIVFILSGEARHITGATRHEISAGDVLVINNRREHGYEDTRDLSLVNVLYRDDLLREAERELGVLPGYHALFTLEPVRWRRREFTSRLRLNARDLRVASEWIEALEAETGREAEGGQFLARNWLMLLIGLLSRRYGERSGVHAEADLRLARLLSRIDREPERDFTLAEMAEGSAMSERSFLRHFREATGFSPADYVIRTRIRRALRLMDQGDARLSVTEIAFRSGFNDSNYFARQFRRITGTSPRAYRSAFEAGAITAQA
jgi:AraC-like DNA-binding protein/quercetin dioxygenase-like cupin family protein